MNGQEIRMQIFLFVLLCCGLFGATAAASEDEPKPPIPTGSSSTINGIRSSVHIPTTEEGTTTATDSSKQSEATTALSTDGSTTPASSTITTTQAPITDRDGSTIFHNGTIMLVNGTVVKLEDVTQCMAYLTQKLEILNRNASGMETDMALLRHDYNIWHTLGIIFIVLFSVTFCCCCTFFSCCTCGIIDVLRSTFSE